MAIAYDSSSFGGGAGVNNFTFSHTCASGNAILVVDIIALGSSDVVSGVTYNGVSMTRSRFTTGTDANWGAWSGYTYYLYSPTSGANTVQVNFGGSQSGNGMSASYTGVAQTGFPDSSANNNPSSGLTVTTTTTTVADNCWTLLFTHNNSIVTASTNSTARQLNLSDNVGFKRSIFDSNGVITPAGSFSMSYTQTNVSSVNSIMSLAPFVLVSPVASTTLYTRQAVKRSNLY